MPAFPMFVDLSQKSVLIVGGGQIALHKAKALEPFGPRLFVIAPVVDTGFDQMPSVTVRQKSYSSTDLEGMDMVIAATDDHLLNTQVAADARECHIPVNVVDEPDLCGFYFGSMITDGDLTVAVSTDGASPAAARELKKRIRQALPEDVAASLAVMKVLRPLVKLVYPDQKQRTRVLNRLTKRMLVADAACDEDAEERQGSQ